MGAGVVPGRVPAVRTFVGKKLGRYRAKWDASGEQVPAVRDDGVVRVSVGAGLRPSDVATAVAFAQSIRNVTVVEVIGDSRRAVDHAKQVFLTAWGVVLPEGAPVSGVGAWAALMLAQTPESGKGAQE